jgi:hypothetical protein
MKTDVAIDRITNLRLNMRTHFIVIVQLPPGNFFEAAVTASRLFSRA